MRAQSANLGASCARQQEASAWPRDISRVDLLFDVAKTRAATRHLQGGVHQGGRKLRATDGVVSKMRQATPSASVAAASASCQRQGEKVRRREQTPAALARGCRMHTNCGSRHRSCCCQLPAVGDNTVGRWAAPDYRKSRSRRASAIQKRHETRVCQSPTIR